MKVYNGEGMILGRLAAVAAKDALLGEDVVIINCENVVVSGRKENTFTREKVRRDRKGYPLKSAKLSRVPERFVRRTVRGMLPWKQARGKDAFRRVLCFRGLPEEYASQAVQPAQCSAAKLPTLKRTTVGRVCLQLGGKQ